MLQSLLATSLLVLLGQPAAEAFVRPVFVQPSSPAPPRVSGGGQTAHSSVVALGLVNTPTELPDSLDDAAAIAADACRRIAEEGGSPRCRVDFDTSVGDETYTTLKSSTEFMQKFVTSLCLATIPGVQEWKMDSAMRLAEARAELREVQQQLEDAAGFDDDDDEKSPEEVELAEREAQLMGTIANQGSPADFVWEGENVRIYFPDEGSAALARRDWTSEVPPCVQFSACGGVQLANTSRDSVIMFFCPRASEAGVAEELLYKTEEANADILRMSVWINPLLVDMGVTGFGMAGRMLRERLIEQLIPAYYLRTLDFGALTRTWPQLFTVWQEDESAEGGYRMIKAMDRQPSNPEVIDIYDIANGIADEPKEGLGLLNALGDFVNGMTRL